MKIAGGSQWDSRGTRDEKDGRRKVTTITLFWSTLTGDENDDTGIQQFVLLIRLLYWKLMRIILRLGANWRRNDLCFWSINHSSSFSPSSFFFLFFFFIVVFCNTFTVDTSVVADGTAAVSCFFYIFSCLSCRRVLLFTTETVFSL